MRTYQIQTGDTLARIAQRHGTTIEALARVNGLANPNLIRSGAKLVIPDGWDGTDRRGVDPRPGGTAATAAATSNPTFPARRAEDLARTWADPSAGAGSGPGTVTTTLQANAFHLTQWGPTSYNSGGAPYGFSDCVPTSAAIALARLGLIDRPGAGAAAGLIDAMRDAAFGRDTTQSAPMGYGTMQNGLSKYGATTSWLNQNDLSSIDAALERGNPVMAAGGPWGAWGASEKAKGNYLNSRDPGAHSVTILGKTPQGQYIVADPLASQSTIAVSADQLRQFFRDGGANSGAMEVKRKDGQAAPGVTPGAPNAVRAGEAPVAQTSAQTTGPEGSAPQVQLQRGMYNSDVGQLQDTLVELGLMTAEERATGPGTFGPRTQAAVERLQDLLIAQGLMTQAQKDTGPGRYGPITLGALNSLQARGQSPAPSGQPAPTPTQVPAGSPASPSAATPGPSGAPAGEFPHLDGINPPADNTSARPFWAAYVRDEVMPRLTGLGVDPKLVKDAVWFGLSEGIYTIGNNPEYAQANGGQRQNPIGYSNFADSNNWSSNRINGQTAFPPGLPYGNFGWRSGNWQVGIAGAQVTDAVDSGSLVKAYQKIYGEMSPEVLGQKMLELIGEGGRDFPNLSIEQLATRENQQWAAVLLRDPLINVMVQTMNPHIRGPHGYGKEIVQSVFG